MLQICSVSQKLEPRDPTGQTPLRIDNPIMDRIEKIIKHRPEFKSISDFINKNLDGVCKSYEGSP